MKNATKTENISVNKTIANPPKVETKKIQTNETTAVNKTQNVQIKHPKKTEEKVNKNVT